jgi:hypothetical protein
MERADPLVTGVLADLARSLRAHSTYRDQPVHAIMITGSTAS